MGYDIDTKLRWISVQDLRTVLQDERFRSDDDLYPNGVGNLLIIRDGNSVGYVDIPFSEVIWRDKEDVKPWRYLPKEETEQ